MRDVIPQSQTTNVPTRTRSTKKLLASAEFLSIFLPEIPPLPHEQAIEIGIFLKRLASVQPEMVVEYHEMIGPQGQ